MNVRINSIATQKSVDSRKGTGHGKVLEAENLVEGLPASCPDQPYRPLYADAPGCGRDRGEFVGVGGRASCAPAGVDN